MERGSTREAKDDDEFNILLRAKLMEEAAEVAASTSREEMIKELGDLWEVTIAIQKLLDISNEDVMLSMIEKFKRKGGFEGRLVLTHDPLSNKTKATV